VGKHFAATPTFAPPREWEPRWPALFTKYPDGGIPHNLDDAAHLARKLVDPVIRQEVTAGVRDPEHHTWTIASLGSQHHRDRGGRRLDCMTINIQDPETVALIHLLAARTGHTDEEAVEAAVIKALGALEVNGTSYRERRNARVRARALEAEFPSEAQPA